MKAAVIGLGVGMQHALALSQEPAVTELVLCDWDEVKRDEARRLFPRAQLLSQPHEIWQENSPPRLVCIATYEDSHAPLAVEALDRGAHLFIEKPLCQTAAELDQIEAAWLRCESTRVLDVNVLLREAPLYQWLREQIALGELGEIYAIDADYLYGRIEKLTHGWRGRLPAYSVTQGGGIHLLDLVLWLTGCSISRTISSVGNRLCTSGTAFRFNDYETILFELTGGALLKLTSNFGCVQPHQHVLRIYGTRGTFHYDDAGARWHTSRDPVIKPILLHEPPLPPRKGARLPAVVRSILHDSWDATETRRHLETMRAIVLP